METTNERSQSSGLSVGYFFHHFACFLVSYFSCIFLAYSCFMGIRGTIAFVFEVPEFWLTMAAFGICLWLVHALFALFNRRVRRSGPILNAIVGSSSFVLGALILLTQGEFVPEIIAIPLSRMPENVLIFICVVGSIAAVAGFAWATQRATQDAAAVGQSTKAAGRGWLQFRLRTLFLIMLASGPFIYWGPPLLKKLFAPNEPDALPSVYYLSDDIQYFPQGPEFKLTGGEEPLKTVSENEDE